MYTYLRTTTSEKERYRYLNVKKKAKVQIWLHRQQKRMPFHGNGFHALLVLPLAELVLATRERLLLSIIFASIICRDVAVLKLT